jgi:hypothetical protein
VSEGAGLVKDRNGKGHDAEALNANSDTNHNETNEMGEHGRVWSRP